MQRRHQSSDVALGSEKCCSVEHWHGSSGGVLAARDGEYSLFVLDSRREKIADVRGAHGIVRHPALSCSSSARKGVWCFRQQQLADHSFCGGRMACFGNIYPLHSVNPFFLGQRMTCFVDIASDTTLMT